MHQHHAEDYKGSSFAFLAVFIFMFMFFFSVGVSSVIIWHEVYGHKDSLRSLFGYTALFICWVGTGVALLASRIRS